MLESAGGERLLVDTGPDLREQLLACAIPAIDAIVFTHAHADHVCGIDEVRGLNRIAGRPLSAHAFVETLDEIKHRFAFAFLPWSPPGFYRPVLTPHPLQSESVVDLCGLNLRLFEQIHGRTRTLGFRVDDFAYSTDMADLAEHATRILHGVDTWLVDAFQREPHGSHAHLGKVLDWSRALRVRRTILTHMGPDLDWAWLRTNLPDGVEPAFDGMQLDF